MRGPIAGEVSGLYRAGACHPAFRPSPRTGNRRCRMPSSAPLPFRGP